MVDRQQPMDYADVRLIMGDQRSGKSTTGIAYAIDDYYEQLTGIIAPSGDVIKAKCLTKDDKDILRAAGIRPNQFQYVRVFSEDKKESKIIKIPKGYKVQSPVKIFANFHLFGVTYVYISLVKVIEYLNSDLIKDGWILSDESVMTDPRNSMTNAGKLMAMFGATVGKRMLHMCQMSQYTNMVEVRFRQFATTKVICEWDKKTRYVTCDIKKRGEPRQSVSFWAPLYWPFFDTNELIKIPQRMIDKTLATVYE